MERRFRSRKTLFGFFLLRFKAKTRQSSDIEGNNVRRFNLNFHITFFPLNIWFERTVIVIHHQEEEKEPFSVWGALQASLSIFCNLISTNRFIDVELYLFNASKRSKDHVKRRTWDQWIIGRMESNQLMKQNHRTDAIMRTCAMSY